MRFHNNCASVPLLVRISLVLASTLLVLATSAEVAAQQPSISVRDTVIVEGNSGTTQATFIIELSGPAPASPPVSFSYATSSAPDGTATAGSDYVGIPTTGPITFAAGEMQKQVVVLVNGDTVDEQQETFFLDISNVQNATVSDSRGTGFINDDDGPTISINDVSLTEGNSGTKVATFTLTLSGPSVEAIAVRAISRAGTATAGSDYNSVNSVVIFQPGDVTKTLDVLIIGDTAPEPNETFFVDLSDAFATTIADGEGQGTILDDETPEVSVAVAPSSVAEDGATNLVYTFTRIGATTSALTVNFSVGGTAVFNTDYTHTGEATFGASSGTVNFGAGNSTATVTIDPTADGTFETDETVILTVTSGTGYNVATPSQATGAINNDDAAPTAVQLVLEESGPIANQAAAFESFLFTRDPFKVENIAEWFNLPAGQNTLVMIFARNLSEPAANVIVNVFDGINPSVDVPATDVRAVPNTDLTQVLFSLPDGLSTGTWQITIKAHSQTSNTGTIRITP